MHSIPTILLQQLQTLDPGAEFSGTPPRIVSSTGTHYYAKLGSPAEQEQYLGEAESLKHIDAAAPRLAPRVLASGVDGDRPYMISEYKNLTAVGKAAAKELAKRLATELHRYKSLEGFGFAVPTYCGATRLQNGRFHSWEACFGALVGDLLAQLAKKGRYASLCAKGERIQQEVIPRLLGARPLVIQPVLLHGDLWSGNIGQSEDGDPVIFDPASYYGHNEADLAIARIFGGFPESFFKTYHEHLPKTEPVEQYDLRSDLYQLFHYLNHTLLFGVNLQRRNPGCHLRPSFQGHYASSAERKMDILLDAKL
ncbi:fructosamine kinase PKL/CAK/FruK [Mycena pura]|uniref:protein-ribulosamine 3-kinase n=1 Tax=Mycena pura TaxID=153505 RepID=A0AAD6YPG5_9AGAR|nr:fructosamine kinase PKL/CAK/FruK [Mycena pura]